MIIMCAQMKHRKYCHFFVNEEVINDGIIKEIVIGPKAKVSINDVYRFLLLNGICAGAKISKSESSYQ